MSAALEISYSSMSCLSFWAFGSAMLVSSSVSTVNPKAISTAPTVTQERSAQVVRKPYPNYKIIVLNDDFNTFEHVAKTLVTYIPHMTPDQAWQLTNQVHFEGQAIVWVGPLEQAELYHSQLTRAGLTMAPLEEA
jgi:ATP-dependent Clp protease adaptor protein ClpS